MAAGDALQSLMRQLQLFEQDIAQLLGGVDIEHLSGDLINSLFQPEHRRLEVLRHVAKELDVDAHAGAFHIGDNRHEIHFQIHQPGQSLFLKLVLQRRHETQGHISIGRAVRSGEVDGHLGE